MAHFAQIDLTSKVINVLVVPDDQASRGNDYLSKDLGLGGNWVQTSYNTRGGVHYGADGQPDGGTALRMNYAGLGYTYNSTLDAFVPPQPYASWVLDTATCYWQAPVPMPAPVDGAIWVWDEPTLAWVSKELPKPVIATETPLPANPVTG
jgi:hypothetical protein